MGGAWDYVVNQAPSSCGHSPDSYHIPPPNGPAGENVFEGQGYSISDAVGAWYSEVSKCPSFPGCRSDATGHFTALVWSGAQRFGCWMRDDGCALCRIKGDDNLDCNTPNMQGCYEQNVPAPLVSVPVLSVGDQPSDWIQAINSYRSKHGVPDAFWDDHVAWGAWDYLVNQAPSSCGHSPDSYHIPPPNGPAGENVFEGQGYTIADAVGAWYSEVSKCPSFPGCESDATG